MDTEPKPEEKSVEKTEVDTPATGQPKKKSPARRLLKGLLWFIGGLLALVIVALLTLPLWINPVGTSLAGAIVPSFTGTAFNLERLNLNPYTGKLLVSGVRLANPDGYAETNAFTLGSLSVDVEVSSLLSDTIHVRDVTVDAPFASYVLDAQGSNNIERILAAVNEKLGPKKEKKEKSETKVVVDKLTVKNVRAVIGAGAFELTSLVVTDFGTTNALVKLEDMKLVNPDGFPEPNAFSLKALSIGVETADLKKKPIVFHDIIVDSTYAGLVYNDAGESNLDVILKPFKGAEEKDEKKDEKKDEVASDEKKDEKEDDTPHVMIDKLDISGTKLQYRKLMVPIPLPTFNDIGKDSKDGATVKEVANQVMEKAKGAMGGLGDLAGMLGSGATNLLGNAQDLIAAGATNVLGNAKDIVGGGVSNVLGGASNLLGGASSAISGGTSNVLSGAKGLLGSVLPGGDDKKEDDKKGDDKKKEDNEPGILDKTTEGAKGLLNKVNPLK